MSKTANQALMLSGFYFILSFILSSLQSNIFYYTSLSLFGVLVLLLLALCFKKNFIFLEKFDSNNPRISNYLKAVGVAQFFDIFFGMIPSMFMETQPVVPVYFKYAVTVYLIILVLSLGYATYFNLSKYKTDKKSKKKAK